MADVQAKGARVIGFGGPGDLRIDIAAKGDGFGLACLPALQMLGEMVALMKGHRQRGAAPSDQGRGAGQWLRFPSAI